jgi:hypothetical protein
MQLSRSGGMPGRGGMPGKTVPYRCAHVSGNYKILKAEEEYRGRIPNAAKRPDEISRDCLVPIRFCTTTI